MDHTLWFKIPSDKKFSRRRFAPPGAPPSTVGGSTVYGYQPSAMRGKIARDYLTETVCKSQVRRMTQIKGSPGRFIRFYAA